MSKYILEINGRWLQGKLDNGAPFVTQDTRKASRMNLAQAQIMATHFQDEYQVAATVHQLTQGVKVVPSTPPPAGIDAHYGIRAEYAI